MNARENAETITLFSKILLAIGATLLLFVDSEYVSHVIHFYPASLSFVAQVFLATTFVALLLLIAVWDSALAVLICIFVACWIAVVRRHGLNGTVTTTPKRSSESSQASRVSDNQAAAVLAQSNRDDDAQYMHSVNTPLPAPNLQASVPMAFTMSDRTYSTTAL